MRAKPNTVYAKASHATWELVRAAYLSGLSAPTVAARFGVSVPALRKRARREGWTKAVYANRLPHNGSRAGATDGAGEAAAPLGADLFDRAIPQFRVEPGGLARRALEQAAEALAGGRPQDAALYARAAESIAKLDPLIPAYSEQETPEQVGWRQSVVQLAVFEQAQLLADKMLRGVDPPASYQAAVAEWRRARGR